MVLVALGFIFVVMNSGAREEDYGHVVHDAYSLRAKFFWGLAVVFGSGMIYTLYDLPYKATAARNTTGAAQVVDVKGYQWRWELSRETVVKDQPVEFRVTSDDVNHGFGIYDTDMHIVAQTQAMPGYTNTLRYTFSKEGTYRILCLEYCGTAHHNMMTEIKVAGL